MKHSSKTHPLLWREEQGVGEIFLRMWIIVTQNVWAQILIFFGSPKKKPGFV
jgi:hypothetical protein